MASSRITALLLLITAGAQAQGFSFGDLFNQASKQKTCYLQQIAAYMAFRSELKQGYNVVKNGLSGISEINTAELNAHTTYYQSLKQPAAAVKNSSEVQDIFDWQTGINASFSQTFTGLTDDEQDYILLVKSSVFKDCNQDLTDLQTLLQTGELQMTDDERLKRLNKLHAAMLDKYNFARGFCNAVKVLAIQRQQEINNTASLNKLYEKN